MVVISGWAGYPTLELLFRCKASPFDKREVYNADRQDDGAARRLSCFATLRLPTIDAPGEQLLPDLNVTAVLLFVFGSLFDAWLNRHLTHDERAAA